MISKRALSLLSVPAAILSLTCLPLCSGGPQEEKAPQPAPGSQPVSIGKAETTRWTDTTVKAAGTPEQKAVLERGKAATVTGELVDVSCYLQLGKRGAAHVPCGSDCIRNGQPAGIVDSDGNLTILMVEEHDPRRHGEIKVADQLAALLAKTVTATGMLSVQNGYRALYVQGSEIASMKTPAPAAAPR